MTTYDSAYMNMDRLGNKFGLIVFDECHHLPGPTYGLAATCALAPFRLGPDRHPRARRQRPRRSSTTSSARSSTAARSPSSAASSWPTTGSRPCTSNLTEEERLRYESARELYRGFLQRHGHRHAPARRLGPVPLRRPPLARGPAGLPRLPRAARRWPWPPRPSSSLLARLLDRHNGDRVLIFTHDNATVYKIARQFLVPVITHQTKTKERREVLLRFNSGTYPIVATSRVLNEGVNVPEANVAIILSGSGSVREHVQRLGRILRKSGDKEAILYEVVTRGTVEEFTSNRRRQHSAYGGD